MLHVLRYAVSHCIDRVGASITFTITFIIVIVTAATANATVVIAEKPRDLFFLSWCTYLSFTLHAIKNHIR